MKKYTFLALGLFLIAPLAHADDDDKITKLNFSETVGEDVEQDMVKATLRYSFEAEKAEDVQNEINKKMGDFARKLKFEKEIEYYTGSYNINKRYNSRTKSYDGWTGSQTMVVEGKDKEQILELVAYAQGNGFATNGLTYFLSREAKVKIHDKLIEKALDLVQHRAQRIANQLKLPNYYISNIDINYAGTAPVARFHSMDAAEGMVMAKSMAAPVVEGKDDYVSIVLSATVNMINE